MKIVAIMPVRNEAWCLSLTARAILKWVDELVILDHYSTDASREIEDQIAEEFCGRVFVFIDLDPVWREMEHRQRLLNNARGLSATHVVILDADEILTGNLLPDIRARIEQATQPMSVLQLPGYNLRGGIHQYHSTGIWAQRWFSVAFKDHPCAGWSGDRLHHREPFPAYHTFQPIMQGGGGVLHLWGASERRLAAKQALYKVTERIRWPAKSVREIDNYYNLGMYSAASKGTGFTDQWNFAPVPAAWWAGYEDLMQYLDVDAEPWQEAECRKLIKEHGRERFAGLDLFGVV